MKKIVISILFTLSVYIMLNAQPQVTITPVEGERRVDVYIDGNFFTSYMYPESLKKPVLWPVVSAGGNEITRRYPLAEKAGERADHPHQVGVWFNYGDVNGLDFWNNSEAISADKANDFGTVFHESIGAIQSGKGMGYFVANASWKNNRGKTLLSEISEYIFSESGNARIIDRVIQLRAVGGKVNFSDNKEGMFAIRVARELEMASKGLTKVTDGQGSIIEKEIAADNVSAGHYLSSEGLTDDDVWASRGRWLKLAGEIEGEQIALVIFDHPSNPGYPTYWHARGYGLFAANPLGQNVFSEGREALNFELENNQTTTFRYRLAVFSGDPSVEEINEMAMKFVSK